MSNSSFTRLGNSGILGVTGRDAVQFLQGYITNDALQIAPDIWQPGAFCNLQGRMVANFRMVHQNDQLLLRMDRQMVDLVQQFLQKYIIFSKAETTNMTDSYCQAGIAGEEAEPVLLDIFGGLPEGDQTCYVNDENIILRLPGDVPRFELWLHSGTSEASLDRIGSHLAPAQEQNWYLKEIQSGWAWITAETSEKFIPQMMNLQAQDAISFEKGCYLGQEIVARMQYLGQLKKRMHRYRVTTDKPPGVGNSILGSDNKVTGEIVSWASENVDTSAIAYEILAVVRDAESDSLHLESGAQLESMPLPYTCAA
jgi:folate-binding protein YgfZ